MPVFKVNIEGFGDLPVTPAFVPRIEILKRPNGTVQSVRDIWRFNGILPVETATGTEGLKEKRDDLIAAFQLSNARVQFKVDGDVFEEISKETHERGAFFRNFDIRQTGGEWVNLLVYDFEVVGEKSVAVDGVLESTKTITTSEDEDGEITVSIRIEARGPDAKKFVEENRPPRFNRATITEVVEEDRVSGVFDFSSSGGDVVVVETISYSPGIFPLEFTGLTRSENPIPFWSSKTAGTVRISGRISTRSTIDIQVPVPKDLEKFQDGPLQLDRDISGTSTGEDVEEEFRYSVQFRIPFEINLAALVAQRRALGAAAYKKASGGSTSAQAGISIQLQSP